jgi:hypothetical protein
MLEPLKKLGIKYDFYKIDDKLELVESIEPDENEVLLYTNYFGIKDDYCRTLAKQYRNRLLIDASQAFYFSLESKDSIFYSPRKFFGLPDGGMLYSPVTLKEELPTSNSYTHFDHLIKRIDLGAEAGYEDFKTNDAALSNIPLNQMSSLTKRLLSSIDFEEVKSKRQRNFELLKVHLGSTNGMEISNDLSCPMVYPYYIEDDTLRQKLIDARVFVATYWPNVLEWAKPEEIEHKLTRNILPLPIDQRYNVEDMQRIVDLIS